jgi:hypothetical protein
MFELTVEGRVVHHPEAAAVTVSRPAQAAFIAGVLTALHSAAVCTADKTDGPAKRL